MRKRAFDVVVISLAAIVWMPVVGIAAMAVLLLSGRPIFYRSRRWVSTASVIDMVKLRVMVPDASKVLEPARTSRFLSTPPDSPLYTGVGRFLDRLGLNEIPQFVHVMRGQMSIVGPRPLTDAVRTCLIDQHPALDARWHSNPAGLTGLPQLVGRMSLTDQQRLSLEVAYADAVRDDYSIARDFKILLLTVMITFGVMKPLSVQHALDLVLPKGERTYRTRYSRIGMRTPGPEMDTDAAA